MQRNLILAIVLSTLILLAFNFYNYYPIEEKRVTVKPEETLPIKEEPKEAIPLKVEPRPILKIEREAKDVVVETKLVKVTFTTEGGRIKSYILKDFDEEIIFAKDGVYPLGTNIRELNRGIYHYEDLGKKDGQRKLKFSYLTQGLGEGIAKGVQFVKTITLRDDSYLINVEISLENTSTKEVSLKEETLALEWLLEGGSHQKKDSPYIDYARHTYYNGELRNVKYKSEGFWAKVTSFLGLRPRERLEKEVEKISLGVSWLALEGKYFLVAIIPPGHPIAVFEKSKDNDMKMMVYFPKTVVLEGKALTQSYKLYVGPKSYDELKKQGFHLEELVYSGWLAPISKATFWVLKFFYRISQNYGVAIILLSILTKVFLLPLTQKSIKSMRAVQDLQPKVNALRERYRSDPQRLNREIMKLYKEHKVNPMGGCLPMILQIPVFFALFSVLNHAIELRRAKFIGWIKDLSVHDPYYVLPILMGISMYIQQRMTPTDPQQTQMMTIMNIVFTFLFLHFPAGLVLYWLVNNLLTIGHQYLINKKAAVYAH